MNNSYMESRYNEPIKFLGNMHFDGEKAQVWLTGGLFYMDIIKSITILYNGHTALTYSLEGIKNYTTTLSAHYAAFKKYFNEDFTLKDRCPCKC